MASALSTAGAAMRDLNSIGLLGASSGSVCKRIHIRKGRIGMKPACRLEPLPVHRRDKGVQTDCLRHVALFLSLTGKR